MTHSPETPAPRELITTALEDWWITTDPAAPFDPPTAADMALTYLAGHGYTITRDPRLPLPYQPGPVPSSASTVFAAFLTLASLACLLCTIAALTHHLWAWSIFALTGTGFFTHELLDELARRRRTHLNF